MDVRLVQVGFLFNKFHRVIRDAAHSEKKLVKLHLEGTDTEIDRNVLQVISDSLIHLIRNSVGHGIETPDQRTSFNKSKEGTITLKAFSESEAVIIEISDDGKGIDLERVRSKAIEKGIITKEAAKHLSVDEVIQLIFEAGFSTVDQVSAISGRGVGMDVVKKALDSIGGHIHVQTKMGEGTTFRLHLPSSMAVKSTLLFELGNTHYAMPLSYTESVVSIYAQEIYRVGNGLVATHLGKPISIVFLKDLFEEGSANITSKDEKVLQRSLNEIHPEQKLDIVVVSHNNRTVGFVVDKLLQQKEIVEKPLAKPVDKVNFISGVTILGNGGVCLVLNVATLVNYVVSLMAKGRTVKQ
jgi:two-component system chemotaxis sensor kinase CheA